MVRNSLVVQSGACLDTIVGGTVGAPSSWIADAQPGVWSWPVSARMLGDQLEILAWRVRQVGTTPWDFAVVATEIVTVDTASLRVVGRRVEPVGAAVRWGSAIVERGGVIFVYGTENTATGARLYLARVRGPSLAGDWDFFCGGASPWSPDPAQAAPLVGVTDGVTAPLAGLPATVSALPEGDGVALLTQDAVFGASVVARHADVPEGPFEAPRRVATVVPPTDADAITYGFRVHPDLAADGLQLLSWDANGSLASLADASLFRPHFIAMPWPPPPEGGGGAAG
jgi:hypothetical protein